MNINKIIKIRKLISTTVDQFKILIFKILIIF